MLFNSFVFLWFLLATFSVYYLPFLAKRQVLVLLIASSVFYSWTQPGLLILLATSVLLNAIVSYRTHFSDEKNQVKWALAGVVINLTILGFFKYGGMFAGLVGDLFQIRGTDSIQMLMSIPLPIGISFYTFEGISLLVDVIRQKKGLQTRERIVDPVFTNHLLNTSLFVTFFPHLIAGPILKARHFYPQITAKYFSDIDWDKAFRAIVVGYFLKVVVADNLHDLTGSLRNPHFLGLSTVTGMTLLFGYSMQIFADFAGYSLIAIGLAVLFGYELPQNFNFPYISRSLSEFWRRWHISLSTWLRDYLYIPLGGNKLGSFRTYLNLIAVMVLGGLWHGAGWSYAVWGAFHGLGLAVERLFTRNPDKEPGFFLSAVRMLTVFSFVSLGWLLFKMPVFTDAVLFLQTMATNTKVKTDLFLVGPVLFYSIPVILYHLINIESIQKKRAMLAENPKSTYRKLVTVAYAAMILFAILNYGPSAEFIYFQF